MVEFRKDWKLLESVRANRASAVANAAPPSAGRGGSVFSGDE
jgi:hypothetical protein